jgi:adenylate cyclase
MLKPKQLIDMLQIYFDELSQVISYYEGTLDKYIGDSIFCFWNAPTEQTDFIFKACSAALGMDEACKKLSAQFVKEGLPELVTRIGLHCGECLTGNSGSSLRLAYTAMGTHVNLASSLEAMNKEYGTTILCSDAIYQQVKARFNFRVVDTISTSVSKDGLRIYELLSASIGEERLAAARKFSKTYNELFLEREFDLAIECYKSHLEKYPDDLAAKNLLTACKKYLITPPRSNWNGVDHEAEHSH